MTQKWNLQDIRPNNPTRQSPAREVPTRRLQQDIASRAPRTPREPREQMFSEDPDLASIEVIDGNKSKRKRIFVTTSIALLILLFGYIVSVFLGGADVTVYPKFKDISAQANFTAYLSNPQPGELQYELLTLDATGEKQVKASGKEHVSLHAEGKIFVYNTKSTASQRLIKNTRFESKDGLIFRIKESIEVPPVTKDAKGQIVPGSIVADVFADGTGEQYNLSPQRFTVPGLKDTDQYDNIYGESVAQFTGGFDGDKYIIDEQELNTAKQALHIELRDKLLTQMTQQRPAGFVVYDDAVTLTFESQPSTEYGDSLATIKEKAVLRVPIFKEADFSQYLASKTIPDYAGDPVTVVDPKTLTFAYDSATTTVSDISQVAALDFSLKGNARIVWVFDEAKLQKELVSLKKVAAPTVFSSYKSISHAQAEVRPFWAKSFPDSISGIKIHTVIE